MSERYRPDRTVFVDMDGVIAGFDAEAIRRVTLIAPGFKADRPRDHFYIADDYPEHASHFRAVSAERGFFSSFPLIDGAVEGWQRILDHGYQPRILSSPLRANVTSEEEKRQWLDQQLGPIYGDHIARDAIITKDKHLHDGIALIDDRGVIPHAKEATWSHIVMHYPHNEAIDTDLRLQNWYDERLEELMDVARERYLRQMGARAL